MTIEIHREGKRNNSGAVCDKWGSGIDCVMSETEADGPSWWQLLDSQEHSCFAYFKYSLLFNYFFLSLGFPKMLHNMSISLVQFLKQIFQENLSVISTYQDFNENRSLSITGNTYQIF